MWTWRVDMSTIAIVIMDMVIARVFIAIAIVDITGSYAQHNDLYRSRW